MELIITTATMEIQVIQSKIYEIRGVRVMLDRDLAELYQVETRTLKQAVRRNIERFPEDFMMRLSAVEANKLIDIGRSQNVIPQDYNIGSSEMFAFTEEGVAMLSGVLRSKAAVQVNIAIMRAFVAMRNYITTATTVTAETGRNSGETGPAGEGRCRECRGGQRSVRGYAERVG